MMPGGEGNVTRGFVGRKHSEESLAKMSENRTGKGGRPGVLHSEESVRKISESQKIRYQTSVVWNRGGADYSEESLKRMSEAQKLRFQNSDVWNKGKKFSEESKLKMSLSAKNLHQSADMRAIMSERGKAGAKARWGKKKNE